MVCLIAVREGVLADDALGVMGITKAVRVIAHGEKSIAHTNTGCCHVCSTRYSDKCHLPRVSTPLQLSKLAVQGF
jgi:hypothetical protein